MWQLKATLASSQSSRKREIFSPVGSFSRKARHVVFALPRRSAFAFRPRPNVCHSSQGFLDNRISSCLLSQETDHRLMPFHNAQVRNDQCTRLKRLRGDKDLATPHFMPPPAPSLKRKKKSSPCGPYFPGTFQCVEAVRRRTLSHESK